MTDNLLTIYNIYVPFTNFYCLTTYNNNLKFEGCLLTAPFCFLVSGIGTVYGYPVSSYVTGMGYG